MELRRVLLEGAAVTVRRDGEWLRAPDGRAVRADEATHLAPVEPTKILCCHLNHVSRVREFQIQLPPTPTYFHKPISALNAHRGAVVRPSNCKWLNYEGEVAIVIGATARNVTVAEAARCIAGYTVANDFGLHDFRDTDAGSMLRVKGADTLCPIGPGLVTDWSFEHKSIQTRVNGVVVQDGSTDEMAWDMHYLVADLARLDHARPRRRHPLGDACQLAAGRPRRRRRRRGRGARHPREHGRRGTRTGQRRGRCPADRDRRGALDRPRGRLGAPWRATTRAHVPRPAPLSQGAP